MIYRKIVYKIVNVYKIDPYTKCISANLYKQIYAKDLFSFYEKSSTY